MSWGGAAQRIPQPPNSSMNCLMAVVDALGVDQFVLAAWPSVRSGSCRGTRGDACWDEHQQVVERWVSSVTVVVIVPSAFVFVVVFVKGWPVRARRTQTSSTASRPLLARLVHRSRGSSSSRASSRTVRRPTPTVFAAQVMLGFDRIASSTAGAHGGQFARAFSSVRPCAAGARPLSCTSCVSAISVTPSFLRRLRLSYACWENHSPVSRSQKTTVHLPLSRTSSK